VKRLAAFVTTLAAYSSAATGAERWTYCVASDLEAKVAWVSAVFQPAVNREILEAEFRAYVSSRFSKRVVAQCPSPKSDRTEVVNDAFAAEQFNQKLGAVVRVLAPRDFPLDR